jgi:hypothetical protein
MMTYTESTAWVVTCAAGLSVGVILGAQQEVTSGAIAAVTMIGVIALGICGKLLRSLRVEDGSRTS